MTRRVWIDDQIGRTFGTLTVQASGRMPSGKIAAIVRCVCGKEWPVDVQHLRHGATRNCGCRRALKHGHTKGRGKSRAYQAWKDMHDRCYRPRNREYHRYGGRGIAVIDRWKVFENFLADMGDPLPGLSLDRVDTNGNYEPGNCRWATKQQQSWNTRATEWIELDGERVPAAVACERLGLNRATISARKRDGWPREFWTAPKGARLKDLRTKQQGD